MNFYSYYSTFSHLTLIKTLFFILSILKPCFDDHKVGHTLSIVYHNIRILHKSILPVDVKESDKQYDCF